MKISPGLRNSIIVFSLLFIAGCANRERARNESVQRRSLSHANRHRSIHSGQEHGAKHLTDLVSAGYLPAIPKDPFTNSATTWIEVQEDVPNSIDRSHPGISDVHSGSAQVSSEGTRYDSW